MCRINARPNTPAGACFRHGRSTIHQVTLLRQDLEDNFSVMKAGAVFVDLTKGYNTAWNRGLICKLLLLLPDSHMVGMMIDLAGNSCCTITTGNNQSCGVGGKMSVWESLT